MSIHEDDWFSTFSTNKLVTNGHSLFQAVPRSEARIQNATLLRTLDALAAGRHSVLAMDIEFYAVLMQDATYGRERFSMSSSPRVSCGPKGACTSVAMFPREIGGHLLIKSSAHTTTSTTSTGRHEERVYKQWTRAGRFHFKIPLELYLPVKSPGPFVDVAFVPWDVASTDERAQSLLRRAEERLVQELVHTDVASRFCIFDDALSERGKALKRDALRAYDADASIPCVPAADLPDIVSDLVAIMEDYTRRDAQLRDDIKSHMSDRGIPYDQYGKTRTALAESRGHVLGEDVERYLARQFAENLMISPNVDEVFSDDKAIYKKLIAANKK